MRLSLLFVFVVSLLSCANERTHNATDAYANYSPAIDTPTYTYRTKKEISPYFIKEHAHIDTAFYQNTYPVFNNAPIDSALHEAIFIERENNVDEAARAFLDGYNEFVEENTLPAVHLPWYKKSHSNIVLNTTFFLTLKTSINEYTGGAHGNHVTLFSVYDLSSLQRLKLDDIIAKGKRKELTALAEKIFRQQEQIDENTALSKDFFFEDGIFALNDNFGLTKNGLVFYYNEYEIKPYSKGITIIEMPYELISGVLNARGKRYINTIK